VDARELPAVVCEQAVIRIGQLALARERHRSVRTADDLEPWLFPEGESPAHGVGRQPHGHDRDQLLAFQSQGRRRVAGMTPSQVMWGVHDKIRAAIKSAREAVERKEARDFSTVVVALARDTVEMVYKEEKILFPLLL
jgi:hypothetical protein